MNYHKKVQVGGELGAELERVWAAIRSNQIKTSAGQRINRMPNGTTISFGTASAEAPALTTPQADVQGLINYVPTFVGAAPTSTQDLAYASCYMEVLNSAMKDVVVLLPPINPTELSASNTAWTFDYEGNHWPAVFSSGMGAGGYWKWSTDYAFVPQSGNITLKAFKTPMPAGYSSALSTQPSGGGYKYYIDRADYSAISSGGWVWV